MTEESVFQQALAKPAGERDAFLTVACAGQPHLRAIVEARLAAQAHEGATITFPPPHEVTGDFTPQSVDEAATLTVSPNHESEATGAYTPQAAAPQPKPTVAPNTADLGMVIGGRYTLIDTIGEGGMGSVYLASQSEPVKRQVALKLIKSGMDSKGVLARFDAERQALAMMDHPNIARIYDGGVTPTGQPFFVMELVQGVPLTEYCDTKRLSIRARLELFIAVCQAVQHAHQKGIIHRDLKPGNVLVTEVDGRPTPKVIDFGVAKATEQKLTDLSFSDVGAIVGTPAYMSPEQADPTLDIDTRSDVYALGVILYELLVGSPPIDVKQFKRGALLEMLRMVREVESPRPSTKLSVAEALPNIAANRDIEPSRLAKMLRSELDWIVLKALEKDRRRRYDTANGFAQDIQRYLLDEPVEARPPSRSYRLRKFVSRNKGQVIAASLVLVALVGGVIGTTVGWFDAREQEKLARDETTKKQAALLEAERQENLAKQETKEKETALKNETTQRNLADERLQEVQYNAALDLIILAQSAFESGNVVLAIERLEQVPAKFRRWEWHYLRRQFEGGLLTMYGHADTVYDLIYSPDGTKLLAIDGMRTAFLWDARTGERLREFHHPLSPAGCCAYSPDGSSIVIGGDHKTILWNPKTGQQLFELKGKTDGTTSIRYSRDGARLVSGHHDGRIRVWSAKTGDLIRELPGHSTEASSALKNEMKIQGVEEFPIQVNTHVSFSPDGQRILSGALRTAKVWDAETGLPVLDIKAHASAILAVAYTPDGSLLLTSSGVSGNYSIKFWEARTGAFVREIHSAKPINNMTISPDGQYLATGTSSGVRLWEVTTGSMLHEFRGHTNDTTCVAFSPDGARLATGSADRTIKVWDAKEGWPPLKLQLTEGTRSQIAYCAVRSADGKTIASANRMSGVILWDAPTGKPRQTLAQPNAISVVYSPNGKILASAGADRAVKLWDAATGQLVRDLTGHKAVIRCLAYTPDGSKLIAASDDGAAHVWNPETGEPLFALKHDGTCQWVAVNATGTLIATSRGKFQDNDIRLWDATTGKPVRQLTAPTLGTFISLTFNREGNRVIGTCSDKSVYVWDVESGAVLSKLDGHLDRVNGVAASPDGARLMTGGGQDHFSLLWDIPTGMQLLKLTGYTQSPTTLSFDERGEWLTSASYDGIVRLFDGRPQPAHPVLAGHTEPIQCSVWNHDGTRLATSDRVGTIKVWDIPTAKVLYTFKANLEQGESAWVNSLSFSPDGTHLAVTSNSSFLTLHDALTGKQVKKVFESESRFVGNQTVRFSVDGKKLVHTHPMPGLNVMIIDIASGKLLKEEPPPQMPITTLSPRGDVVAVISNKVVKLVPVTISDTERVERLARTETRLPFHWEEYQKALNAQNVMAAQFHRRRLEGFGDLYVKMRVDAAKQYASSGVMALRFNKYEDAVERLQKAVDLDSANQPAANALADAKKFLLEFRLKLYQNGEYAPTTTADRVDLLTVLAEKKQYRRAAELYRTALHADVALANDLKSKHRFKAARFAAMLATGKANDDAVLDDKARMSWRKQAYDWLQADLGAYAKLLQTGPPAERQWFQEQLQQWQKDTDLSGLREATALEKLPATEQKNFTELWAEVARLLRSFEQP